MKTLLTQIFLIAAAIFFAGLIIYCYYIVLTSKDENYKSDEKTSDHQSPVQTDTNGKQITAEQIGKKQASVKPPAKHPGKRKKISRRAA